MKIPFLLICFLAASNFLLSACQRTAALSGTVTTTEGITITVQVPENTPADAALFMASNYNDWNPGDSIFRLTKTAAHTYSLQLEPDYKPGREFKFTRGGWETVETAANGNNIENRQADFTQSGTYTYTVAAWQDQFAQKAIASSAADNVQLLDEAFAMPQLGRSRRIWLYLPTDYAISGKHYPVLYLHDGQNLFDQATGFSGEWGVDESLNTLQQSGAFEGIIVVGIDNGGDKRIAEYSPWANDEYGGGEGAQYIQFIAETLKPYIDQHYRTQAQAANTGLGGSSLGALISLYAAVAYPDTFGKFLLFSPAFWFNEAEIYPYVEKNFKAESYQQFIFVASEKESETMVPLMERMAALVKESGAKESNIQLHTTTDGAHSEWYWKREFPKAFRWLFIE